MWCKRKYEIGKRWLAIVMVITMMIGLTSGFNIGNRVYAVEPPVDVYDFLENKEVQVLQGSPKTVINDGGSIDPEEEIEFRFRFDVPIAGDHIGEDPQPDNVKGGDYAVFDFPDNLKVSGTTGAALYVDFDGDGGEDPVQVAVAVIESDQVTFTFHPNLENLSYSGCSIDFSATMSFDLEGTGYEADTYNVLMLDKNYTITVPNDILDISGTKSGSINGGNVLWTVAVTSEYEGDDAPLKGVQLYDDLSSVGDYVDGSFKVEGVTKAADYDAGSGVLTYDFADDDEGTVTVSFETVISDSKLFGTGTQYVRNNGKIKKSGISDISIPQASVSFTPNWITKEGVANDNPSGSTYDSVDRTITWTIEANLDGLALDNVTITDKVGNIEDSGDNTGVMDFVSAQMYTYNGSGYDTYGGEMTAEPVGGVYDFGDITSKIQLIITAEVNDDSHPDTIEIYSNTAVLDFEFAGEDVGRSASSPEVGINIGFDPIDKAAGAYNPSTHRQSWAIDVDTKDLTYGGSLRVLDMVVYGDSFTYAEGDYTIVGGSTDGLLAVSKADIANISTKRIKQQMVADSVTTSAGLSYTVHTIEEVASGKAVADVLVITGSGGAGMNHLDDHHIEFDTLVMDPDVYAKNGNTTIKNMAYLFSAGTKMAGDEAEKSVSSQMLKKDRLDRDSIADFEVDNSNYAKLNVSGDSSSAYDYNDNTVYYRIHVNANNLADATNDVTQDVTVPLGSFTVTDQLPDDWEFKKIGTEDYLLYEATPGSSGKVTATGLVADTTGILQAGSGTPIAATDTDGGSMAWTFTSLTKPYMIVVKAGPVTDNDNEVVRDYFDRNQDLSFSNGLTMTNTNMSNVTASASVTINSTVVDKSLDNSNANSEAYLTWDVDYNPYNLEHVDAYIEDNLPSGVELRNDADGNLIYTDNIVLHEMTMGDDGELSYGDEVTLPDESVLSYDRDTRVLTFNMPSTDKAYRLRYITDITGDRGTSLNNTVKLYTFAGSSETDSKGYIVSDSAHSASLTRSGYVKINKTKTNGGDLAGAAFTLYAMDGTTVIRQATTNDDGEAYLTFIPEGSYLLKETGAPATYALSDEVFDVTVGKVGSSFTTTIDGDSGNELTVVNYKENTVGELVITKAVAGDDAELDKTFTFRIDFTGASDDYTYYGSGGKGNGTIGDNDTFTLKNGQSIRIVGLPKDAGYLVTENDYTDEGYVTGASNVAGTIEADVTKTAAFTNTFTKVKIGDYVWYDTNQDGIQDDSELPVSGITVKLYKKDGEVLTIGSPEAVTTTDGSGYYEFDELYPDDYYIVFDLPEAYSVTEQNQGGDDDKDSDAQSYTLGEDGITLEPSVMDTKGVIDDVTVTFGNDDMSFDVGIYQSYSLGDYVWLDNNSDGLQDSDEVGLNGVSLHLYDSHDDATPIASTITGTKDGEDGYYIFDDLSIGSYYVKVVLPAGYEMTEANVGTDLDSADSDFNPETLMTTDYEFEKGSERHNPTVDAGVYQLAGLGNYVWLDSNYDGIQNDTEGVADVLVTLYKVGVTDPYDTMTTNSSGGYHFTDLPPGDYYVVFEIPDTYYLTKSNPDGDNNDTDSGPIISSTATSATSKTVTLLPNSSNLTLDMGLYQQASLGDYVWYDVNKDGLQDDTDEPVVGMTVTLLDSEGATVGTTVTGDDGGYLFDGLVPGTYSVQFEPVGGYRFTTQNAVDSETSLNDDTADSDADGSGLISSVTLESGQHDPDNDAGLRRRSGGGGGTIVETTTVAETTTTVPSTTVEETTVTTTVPTTTVADETTVSTTPLFQKETTTAPTTTQVTTTTTDEGQLPQPTTVQSTTAPPVPTYPEEIVYKPNRNLDRVVVKDEPDKGTVEIIDGEIVYSPGPTFDGTDQIVLVVTNPDGSEEEIIIDIFEELPEAGMPATGGIPTDVFIGFGMTFFGLGLGLRSKRNR